MCPNILIAKQRGAAAVEFAIVLVPLLLILFGTIEFGVLFFDKAVITNASREGARRGVVWWTNQSGSTFDLAAVTPIVQSAVSDYCTGHLITFGAASSPNTPTPTLSGTAPNRYITVTVSYNYNFLILPKLVTGISGPLTLTGQTRMRIEE